jgi:hypothetical protein
MQGDGATQYLDLESGRVILVTEDFQHYEDAGDGEDDLPEWMQERTHKEVTQFVFENCAPPLRAAQLSR